MATLSTIEDIRQAAKNGGSEWFGKSNMEYFATIVLPDVYPVDNGAYFVTSETIESWGEGTRYYSVRLITVNPVNGKADITTVGTYMGYNTANTAKLVAAEAQASHTN
jgi:hypothetical protein